MTYNLQVVNRFFREREALPILFRGQIFSILKFEKDGSHRMVYVGWYKSDGAYHLKRKVINKFTLLISI